MKTHDTIILSDEYMIPEAFILIKSDVREIDELT